MNQELLEGSLSILEKSDYSIVASIDEDGFPNLKAMLKPRENDGLKTFYFTTNTSSLRVKQFKQNSKAAIYFYDGRSFLGLMLKGEMEVLEDQNSKNRIWRVGDEMYYPQGKTDPDYCVLKFTAISARLYQNFSSENFNI